MPEVTPKKPISSKEIYIFVLNLVILGLISSLFYLSMQHNAAIESLKSTLRENYVDKSLYNELEDKVTNFTMVEPEDPTPDNTPVMAYEEVTYTGLIRNEKIPHEYALGEYWYILYFDEPQIIETVAGKMSRDSIQVVPSTITSEDMVLDVAVEVKGRLSYGYAESRIVLLDKVTQISKY